MFVITVCSGKKNMTTYSSPEEETNLVGPGELVSAAATRFTTHVRSPELVLSADFRLPTSETDGAPTIKESQPLESSESAQFEVCDLSFLLRISV